MRRGLRASLLWVHCEAIPSDHVIVEGVLVVCLHAIGTIEPDDVRFVITEQEGRVALRVQGERVQLGMACFHCSRAGDSEPRLARVCFPGPGVAEPDLREQMDRRLFGTAIVDRHLHQHVFRPGLGVLDEDVEVAVVVEDAGVEQLELRPVPAAAAPSSTSRA